MDSVIRMKNVVLAGLSMILAGAAHLLGGWDVTLQTLIGAMAVDYLTGVIVAGVFKKSAKTDSGALESRAGFKGLMRKVGILLMVFLGVLLDRFAGTALVRPAVCVFFTANEGLSILENFGLMGVPFPKFLQDMLEDLRSQGDKGEK